MESRKWRETGRTDVDHLIQCFAGKNGNQNQKMNMALEKKLVVWAEINGRFVYICHVIRAQMTL